MKKIILVSFILSVAQISFAQQLFITPILGLKADITRIPFYERHLVIPDYNVIDEHRYWFTVNPKPVFGMKLEFAFRKNNFSTGILINDHVNSRYEFSFMSLQNGQNQLVRKTFYTGVHVLKVPLTYQYEWFTTKNEKFAFNFHLGANLLFGLNTGEPYKLIESEKYILAEGNSAGKEIELNTYLINSNAFFGHTKLKLTVDLGMNLSFRISDNFRLNTALYFERGFKKSGISAVETEFKIDGYNFLRIGNGSFGSALHFKVAIPILIKDYKKK